VTSFTMLGWVLLAGVGSGFVFQRSRLCFVSALRDLFLFRAIDMTRAILLLFLVTVAGGATIYSLRQIPATPVVGPTPLGALLGGGLFAFGMILGGSCAAGAFWRFGEGQISQVYILAGLMVGTWAYQKLPLLSQTRLQPTFAGWTAVGLLFIALAALYAWERLRAPAGEELPAERRGGRLWAPWSPEIGALAMAALLVGFMALTGQTWGVTRAFLFNDLTPVTFAVGLTVGGFVGAKFGHEWRRRPGGTRPQILIRLLGGVIMGYGARVGWGCTLGAVLSGMVNLSVQPWYWLLGAVVGAALGSAVLRRYMSLYL